MAKIRIDGLEDLQNALKKNATLADVKKVVRHHGSQLQRKIQQNADFKGHWAWEAGKGKVFKSPTGTTKRSVGLEIKDGGMTAESGPKTDYAPYLEVGTRFMSAQPFVKPAYDEQKELFKSDMQKLVR